MNKAELSAKWGKYLNTDKLVDDVRELLRSCNHRNTEHGVCSLLDKFFTNKENLIQLFITSKNYIGGLRIKTTQSFDREVDSNQVSYFMRTHRSEFTSNKPLSDVDNDGKKMMDYMKADVKSCTLSDIVGNNSLREMRKKLLQFMENGYTVASYNHIRQVDNYLNFFRCHAYPTLQRTYTPEYDSAAPTLKAGTKTSRAFNAFCHYYGFDKRETYNKSFAQYADLVSVLKRNMDFVISLNPLDYLTMSNGVSWHSCHNIMDGGWKGGCLSYMLDTTSIITFVVEDINSNENIHMIPKNYRQMIHYDDGMFMQNRLYPQANDGAADLYSRFREFVVTEFNSILNTDGEWKVDFGYNACREHVSSEGVHYTDYLHNDRCNIFYPHAKADGIKHKIMTVGHSGICTHCGCEYTESRRLAHSECTVRRNNNE